MGNSKRGLKQTNPLSFQIGALVALVVFSSFVFA